MHNLFNTFQLRGTVPWNKTKLYIESKKETNNNKKPYKTVVYYVGVWIHNLQKDKHTNTPCSKSLK